MSLARSTILCLAVISIATSVGAATYFAVSDDDLVSRTRIAVLARAGTSSVVASAATFAETRTTFEIERVARGAVASTIQVALPGGTLSDGSGSFYWMPQFQPGAEYVLFLYPRLDGSFGVTEYELGIFNVYRDVAGNSFALRGRIQTSGAVAVSSASPLHPEAPRDLGLFLDFISRFPGPSGDYWGTPVGSLTLSLKPSSGTIVPLWSNLTGTLFRWESFSTANVGYVDDDTSDEVASPPGPQGGVVGGGLSEIQAAVATWNNDSSSAISYHYAGAGSNAVSIELDNVSQFGGTGIPCNLGTIGLGGVTFSGSHSFKGESYLTITGGNVWMRRWDCATSNYLNSAFQNGVTHELGHVLGLGHPDTDNSPHDNTPNDVSGALMISLGQYSRPTGLGSDDIEGVCYLYGSCTGATSGPVANFTFSPLSPQTGTMVNFTDLSSGSPTSWSWNFGDPGSGGSNTSSLQNPSHSFSAGGQYGVQLSVSNVIGPSQITRTVTVSAPATPPVAGFTFNPSQPVTGQTVSFTNTSTGSPTSQLWNFGDGFLSTGVNPHHDYSAAGPYSVVLTVSNSAGSNHTTRNITVTASTPLLPTSNFSFTPNPPTAGDAVAFSDHSSGAPTSWSWSFGDPGSGAANSSTLENPSHVYADAGNYLARLTVSNSFGSNSLSILVSVLSAPAGCTPNSTTLCLNDSRFRVQVAWRALNLNPVESGVGHGVAITPDTGYFWFFSSANIEVVVKVVDGRSFNGSFWIFYGALSNVDYTITVTDTLTGTVKTYHNPQGQLASVGDTSAFPQAADVILAPTGPSPDEEYRTFSLSLGSLAATSSLESTAPCANATRLCLNNSRFRVEVSWRAAKLNPPESGAGQAVGLTPDTGYFWFFSSNNVELAIKVVDGRAFNGKFWVFYGALSNIEYTITVTDSLTGAVRTYVNPQDRQASVADTSAF